MPGESIDTLSNWRMLSFQSTPGINAGRILCRPGLRYNIAGFQSTPGINAGRILACKCFVCLSSLFQSTPGINAGRIKYNWSART